MAGLVQWLVSKLRQRRFSMQTRRGKALIFGCIYEMNYRNFKHDPQPLIFVMYSGYKTFVHKSGFYTDGLNLNYMDYNDRAWLGRMIYLAKKGNQRMQPYLFYRFLKMNRPNIIRKCYRRYHTNMMLKPRMVSAGFTHLQKMTYPTRNPWINGLNESLEPREIRATKVQIAYSPVELNNRIAQAINAKPIQSMKLNP